jgi:hypothetical protein
MYLSQWFWIFSQSESREHLHGLVKASRITDSCWGLLVIILDQHSPGQHFKLGTTLKIPNLFITLQVYSAISVQGVTQFSLALMHLGGQSNVNPFHTGHFIYRVCGSFPNLFPNQARAAYLAAPDLFGKIFKNHWPIYPPPPTHTLGIVTT